VLKKGFVNLVTNVNLYLQTQRQILLFLPEFLNFCAFLMPKKEMRVLRLFFFEITRARAGSCACGSGGPKIAKGRKMLSLP